MKIEVLPSSSSYTNDDQENLSLLLDAFGSKVSLEDIASAYCQADRDVSATAEILCNKQASSSAKCSLKSEDDLETTVTVSSDIHSNESFEDGGVPKTKSKRSSASLGTVSGVIGRDYVTHRPQATRTKENYKPVKLNSDEFPVSEIWDEERVIESTSRGESMSRDIEEFLFKMLGNGFQLEMSVIRDVVGQCGYNMQKSIDKLLDLSAESLEKSDDVIGIASVCTLNRSIVQGSTSCRGQSPPPNNINERSENNASKRDEVIEPQAEKKKKDISREVLEALFCVPERVEEMREYTPALKHDRPSPYGRVVSGPLEESIIENFTFITRQPVNRKTDESSYEELREAVKEHWATMKEYYKAAVDAFAEDDRERAQKLMDKGNFFKEKAQEADEKSAQKLTQDSEEEEEMSLNVHYLDPKDALHHFKLNLTSLSFLPSIRLLKVVVGSSGGDAKDGRRKRKHLITRFLEKEGIPWTEEGDGWVILIRVDEIDPVKLTLLSK